MKKNLYLCFFLFLILFMPKNISASCSDSESVRLSNLARNIKTAYTYNEKTKKFTITITNTKKDLTIEYVNDNKKYNTDKELNFNNLYSGKHTFMIYANTNCSKEYLTTKYVNLPYYNEFYGKYPCNEALNYEYCKKWLKTNYNEEFQYNKILGYIEKNKVTEAEKKEVKYTTLDKIINYIKQIYVEYYYIVLPSIISILCLIIYIKNKKENLV